MRKLLIYIFFVHLVFTKVSAQTATYPQGYFRSPIDSPIYLSGNFCTLRNDHFHSGIDITTYDIENMPVFAAADGWVSRIKISPYGYGKALYIDHPNGYTTVYGHLNAYAGDIGKYVKDLQYKNQDFEMDVFPAKGELPVMKGQWVALSGNTGGSSGPHIHFEIRDTKSEEIINPVLFGIDVNDTIAPEIKHIAINRIYSDDFKSNRTLSVINYGDKNPDTVFISEGPTGIDAVVNDYTTFKVIPFNPYEINLFVDNEKYYTCKFERFSFDKSKYVNAHLNFANWWNYGIRYQRLYKLTSNQLYFYQAKNNGVFDVEVGKLYHIKIQAKDLAGYSKEFEFNIFGVKDTSVDTNKYITETSANSYSFNDASDNVLSIPEKITDFELGNGSVRIKYEYSDFPITFIKPCKLSIKYVGKTNLSKSSLYYIDYNKNIIYAGGVYKEQYITASIMKPGIYFIGEDMIKPTLKPMNLSKKNHVIGKHLSFKIKDKLSGIGKYQVYLNGKWVLSEYDAKSDMLTYFFDDQTPQGWNIVMVKVYDKVGNETFFSKKVYISR